MKFIHQFLEKKKVPSERSAFPLMGTMKKNGKVPVNFVLNIIIKY